jgi:aerobic carbon-monoxide dehydrogenase large subunit
VRFLLSHSPLGIKGVGRAGSSPGAAIANAVEDAPADYGVEVDRLPVTSERILEMLRSARPG